jgi:hypothetical protein
MQVRTTRSAQVRRTTERRRTMTIDAGRSPMVVEPCLLDQHGDRSAALASRRRRCAAGPEVSAQASRSSGRERLVLRSGIRKTRTSSWQHPFDVNERLRIDLDAIGERYPRMNAQVDTGVVRRPWRQDDRPRGRASRLIHLQRDGDRPGGRGAGLNSSSPLAGRTRSGQRSFAAVTPLEEERAPVPRRRSLWRLLERRVLQEQSPAWVRLTSRPGVGYCTSSLGKV